MPMSYQMAQIPSAMTKCAKCGEAVEIGELEIHIKEELLYYPYRCHICRLKFLTESQLRNTHFPRKHPECQVQILANENERLESEVAEILKLSMAATTPQSVRPYRSLPIANPYPTTPGSHQNTFYPLIPRMFQIPKTEPRDVDVISLEPLSDPVDPSIDTPARAKRGARRPSRTVEQEVPEPEPVSEREAEKTSFAGKRRGPKLKNWQDQSQDEEAPALEPQNVVSTESPKLEVTEELTRNDGANENEAPDETPRKKRKLVCPDENPLLSAGTKAYHRFSRKVQSLMRKRIKESNLAERCGKCDFEYKPEHTNLYSAIENHLLTHLSDKAYACPICEQKTNVIERHFRVYHAPDDIVPRSQLDMRPEIVEEAIDNIFECFPDLKWIRELSKEEIGRSRAPRRQPDSGKKLGRPPKKLKADPVKIPRLKTPMVSYDENIAPEFAKEIENVRRRLREQQMQNPVEIRCQVEGCKFALRTVTGVHIERHIVAHYNQPLYECSECGEETKYLYHHTLSKHKDDREEVMRCSKNFKGLHEQDLLELLRSAFPVKEASPIKGSEEADNTENSHSEKMTADESTGEAEEVVAE